MAFVHKDGGVYRASVCGVLEDVFGTGLARGSKNARSSPDELVRIVELSRVLLRYVRQPHYVVAIAYGWWSRSRTGGGPPSATKKAAKKRESEKVEQGGDASMAE
eukprot:1898040-Pleurochrysis_carterae.AAC.3